MTKMITCLGCGEVKEFYCKRLCRSCYEKQHTNKVIVVCKNCNLEKIHFGKGLCSNCYRKQWRKDNSNYDRNWLYKNNLNKPMDKNKNCSRFLGVHVAERVLSKVFKDVKRMPMNNSGYDFICSNNYKIDVKSSCQRKGKNFNQSDRWTFIINKNKIADYFLCLAFDNRTNLNPIYLWLIPGNVVNDKVAISITESRLNKWNKYIKSIDEIINYCNIMKGGGNGYI